MINRDSELMNSEVLEIDRIDNKFMSKNDISCVENEGTENSEICTECGLGFGNKRILHIHTSVVHINPISDSSSTLSIANKGLIRKISFSCCNNVCVCTNQCHAACVSEWAN